MTTGGTGGLRKPESASTLMTVDVRESSDCGFTPALTQLKASIHAPQPSFVPAPRWEPDQTGPTTTNQPKGNKTSLGF